MEGQTSGTALLKRRSGRHVDRRRKNATVDPVTDDSNRLQSDIERDDTPASGISRGFKGRKDLSLKPIAPSLMRSCVSESLFVIPRLSRDLSSRIPSRRCRIYLPLSLSRCTRQLRIFYTVSPLWLMFGS